MLYYESPSCSPENPVCQGAPKELCVGSVVGKYLGQSRGFREHLLQLQESQRLETRQQVVAFTCCAQSQSTAWIQVSKVTEGRS